MGTLIAIIISGFATGYVVEFLTSVLPFVAPKLIKQVLTLPSSLLGLWILGIHGTELFVYVPASAFVSLVVMLFAAKPVEVAQVINRR
jgi:hypothetical protein